MPVTTSAAAPRADSPSGPRASRKRHHFAPLSPSATEGQDRPRLKGIVFDVDGTLCLPQNYMFKEMRAALGIPRSVDILDHIRSLSNDPDGEGELSGEGAGHVTEGPSHEPALLLATLSSPRARAIATVQAIERRAMTSQRPQPGLRELMAYLTQRGVRKALCTRNFPAPVHHLLTNHLPDEHFEPIVTRDTAGIQPKPSPEGIWTIAQHWARDPEPGAGPNALGGREEEVTSAGDADLLALAQQYLGSGVIMVGDSIDDMAAGYRAGAATVLLVNDENAELADHHYTGMSIRRLDDLIDILETGFRQGA